MRHVISTDRKTLSIYVDEEEREQLRALPNDGPGCLHSDAAMIDFLEPLTCNSELSWVSDMDAHLKFGDLTEAPCLGIYGCVFEEPDLQERWRWMGYETKSVLETLRDKGEIHFSS
jgi:hypothetical protein